MNIKQVVAEQFGLSEDMLNLRTQQDWIVTPRHVCYYVQTVLHGGSLRQISRQLELDFDPKTVSRGIYKVKNWMDTNPDFREKVNNIINTLKAA